MPCGGIYPYDPDDSRDDRKTIDEFLSPGHGGCWVCSKGGAKHFCEEWDTFIHARCVPSFLQTEEGQIIISHRHHVLIDFALEETK